MLIVESTLLTWFDLFDLFFAFEYFYKTQEVVQGVSEKTLFKDFLTRPWDRLMPVVTIVLVKVVGEMLDDD